MTNNLISSLALVALLSWGAEANRWNNMGKTTPAINRVSMNCLAKAPADSKFALVLDVTNSSARRERFEVNKGFINATFDGLQSNNFYVAIIDGSNIFYFQENGTPLVTTSTTVTTTTKTTVTTTVTTATSSTPGNSTTKRGNTKTTPERTTRQPVTRTTRKPKVPALHEMVIAAMKARSEGQPIQGAVVAPESLAFAIVVTDGAQQTKPSIYPASPRLIFDIGGKWTAETAVNYSGQDIIILEQQNDLSRPSMVKTIRYRMCQQIGGNTGNL